MRTDADRTGYPKKQNGSKRENNDSEDFPRQFRTLSLSLHIHITIIYIRGNQKENPSTNHKISGAWSCEDSSHTQPRWTCGLAAGRASKGRRYDHALDFLTPHHLNLTFLTYFDNELNLSMNIYMRWNQGEFLHRGRLANYSTTFYTFLYTILYYTLFMFLYPYLFLSIISPYFSLFLLFSVLFWAHLHRLQPLQLFLRSIRSRGRSMNRQWGLGRPRGAERGRDSGNFQDRSNTLCTSLHTRNI